MGALGQQHALNGLAVEQGHQQALRAIFSRMCRGEGCELRQFSFQRRHGLSNGQRQHVFRAAFAAALRLGLGSQAQDALLVWRLGAQGLQAQADVLDAHGISLEASPAFHA